MRKQDLFRSQNIHSVRLDTDNLTYLGPKIWNAVPQVIKNSESLYVFKTKTKEWIPVNYPSGICKLFIFQNS